MKLPKTDDNDRTHKNDANSLTYGQCFFPDKCLMGGSFHFKWSKPGHDQSQNLIKKLAKLLQYIRYNSPENFILISCAD